MIDSRCNTPRAWWTRGVTRISTLETVTWKDGFSTNFTKSLELKVVLSTVVGQTSGGGYLVESFLHILYVKKVEGQGTEVRSEELVRH